MSPSPLRWAFALAVIGLFSAGCVAVASRGNAVAFAAGAAFCVPLSSLGEWLVHHFLYHRGVPGLRQIKAIHHTGHHWEIFPPDKYVNRLTPFAFMRVREPALPWRMSDNALDEAITKWGQVGLHFVAGILLILIPAYAVTGSVVFFAGSLAMLTVISWLLAHVHGRIHTPVNSWVERQWWFKALDRQHYIHHMDAQANLNFMLPLVDLLLGTRRFEPTAEERRRWPSFEESKPEALAAK